MISSSQTEGQARLADFTRSSPCGGAGESGMVPGVVWMQAESVVGIFVVAPLARRVPHALRLGIPGEERRIEFVRA